MLTSAELHIIPSSHLALWSTLLAADSSFSPTFKFLSLFLCYCNVLLKGLGKYLAVLPNHAAQEFSLASSDLFLFRPEKEQLLPHTPLYHVECRGHGNLAASWRNTWIPHPNEDCCFFSLPWYLAWDISQGTEPLLRESHQRLTLLYLPPSRMINLDIFSRDRKYWLWLTLQLKLLKLRGYLYWLLVLCFA